MACLGEPSRYRLVKALIGGPRCVTDLAAEVGLSQSCTTRHLQALERRNVVRGTRDGKRVLYAIQQDRDDLMPLIGWAMGQFASRASIPASPPEVRRAPSKARIKVHMAPEVRPTQGRNGALPDAGGTPSRMTSGMPSGMPSGIPQGNLSAAPGAPAAPREPEPSQRRRAGDLEDFLL
jgi:ArsR family transcriptional regulator